MSYPFTTFPLVNRVGVTNPYANIDARYGPWRTLNDALTSFNTGLRFPGLTVAISGTGGIVEYWYKDGVGDGNLVLKTAGGVVPGNVIVDGGNTNTANITIGTNDNYHLNLETAGSTRMIITSSGNVGIGNFFPTDRLEINGTVRITGNLPSIRTTTNRFSVNETNTVPPNEAGMVSQFASGPYGRCAFAITHTGINTAFFGLNAQTFSIGGEGDTDVRFVKGLSYGAIDILNSGTEVMRIKASNNSVGIGTNDPSQRLTVAGNLSANGIAYINSLNLKCETLPFNLLQNTFYPINAELYNTVYVTVSADQKYLIDNLTKGTTLTFYVSGNHDSLKRHLINVLGSQLNIYGAGQADRFYTFKNHVTKVTITRVESGNTTISRVFGTAEVIRTDLNTGQGGLGFILLEQQVSTENTLLQENGDRLVIRNFT